MSPSPFFFNPESLNVHQKKKHVLPGVHTVHTFFATPRTWGCLVPTCLTQVGSTVEDPGVWCILLDASGILRRQKTCRVWCHKFRMGLHRIWSRTSEGWKGKGAFFGWIRFRMWKITGEKTKVVCFCSFFAWNKHFLLFAYWTVILPNLLHLGKLTWNVKMTQ